jgi:hypothetical protein
MLAFSHYLPSKKAINYFPVEKGKTDFDLISKKGICNQPDIQPIHPSFQFYGPSSSPFVN